MRSFVITFLIFLISVTTLSAQTPEQKKLEEQKKTLIRQINEITQLHSKQTQERKSVVEQIGEINQKIQRRKQLIQLTQQQILLLDKDIDETSQKIQQLREELSQIQKEYADLIVQSYKNRSPQNRIIFILSSKSFSQGYKRIMYMRHYSEYRKKQAKEIQEKSTSLQQAHLLLESQRQEKEAVVTENQKEELLLSSEKKQQESLVQAIRKKEKQYAKLIREKKQKANTIDREIQRIIRQTIAESNKKQGSGRNAKNTFTLTPEAQKVASNFEANKGKLIWPVSKGFKSQGFGVYSDPVYPDVKHMNNGVTIETEPDAKARAIFEGEVSAIFAIPGGNRGIQVRHGNYISIYSNLTEIYVSKGDKVHTKTPLGKIYTAPSGKTELKFYLYKNEQKLNPEIWIFKL